MPRKKVRISIGNIDLFAYSIFKNIEFSSGQGVVQIKRNLAWSIPWVPGVLKKRIFGMACQGKNLVFHTEICFYFK